MDIILDSNVYLSDIRLRSNRFANFFDYLRRTGSSIILPALVRDEIVQKHREKLTNQVSRVEKELKELNRYTIDDVTFRAPYLKGQTKDLKALLRKPSRSVRTTFLDGTDGVNLKEVIRRGINRVPPASESGEELRDVVLWLIVLAHAKSTSGSTAFVTADMGFWEVDKPKDQILEDIESQQVDIRLYKDLAAFTRDNALVSEAATDAWLDAHLTNLTGTTLEELVLGPLRDSLKASRALSGVIQNVTTTQMQFIRGSIYKIDSRTDFADLLYRGFFVVESMSVRYQPSLSVFGGPGVVSLATLLGGAPGVNPLAPLGRSPQGQGGEAYRSSYDVEAEIRLSCRVEANNTELEVDEAKPVKIALRR